jgi:predicted aspartyl protease
MRLTAPFATAAIIAAFCGGASQAMAQQKEPCPLQEWVTLDMAARPDAFAVIPASLNGMPVQMMLDTGSIFTSITQSTAAKLGLPIGMGLGGTFVNNINTNQKVLLSSLRLGKISSGWGALVVPDSMLPAPLAGLLGQDVLASFDVEFDPDHGKLNLFLPNTCTTDAAYWAHVAPVAVVPFNLSRSAHMVIQAFLDGKQVNIVLDTGASSSLMSIEAAKQIFNLADDDSRLKVVRDAQINGGPSIHISAFPFSTLQFEGVAITNPVIELIPKESLGRESGVDMILGANVLRQLRMYIAYKEKKIYLTSAGAN